MGTFTPKHDWKWLVEAQRSGGDDWKIVGEYADEETCLREARTRNEPKLEEMW